MKNVLVALVLGIFCSTVWAEEVFVGDMTPLSVKDGTKGPGTKNKSWDNHQITIAGHPWVNGIGTHCDSEIVYNATRCTKFHANCGLDDEKNGGRQVYFEVYVDKNLVWQSGMVTNNQSIPVDINLPANPQTITLRVFDLNKHKDNDHVDWGDAKMERTPLPPAAPAAVPPPTTPAPAAAPAQAPDKAIDHVKVGSEPDKLPSTFGNDTFYVYNSHPTRPIIVTAKLEPNGPNYTVVAPPHGKGLLGHDAKWTITRADYGN